MKFFPDIYSQVFHVFFSGVSLTSTVFQRFSVGTIPILRQYIFGLLTHQSCVSIYSTERQQKLPFSEGGRHLVDIIGDFSWTKGVTSRGHFCTVAVWTQKNFTPLLTRLQGSQWCQKNHIFFTNETVSLSNIST